MEQRNLRKRVVLQWESPSRSASKKAPNFGAFLNIRIYMLHNYNILIFLRETVVVFKGRQRGFFLRNHKNYLFT